jgi:hypothetical protein
VAREKECRIERVLRVCLMVALRLQNLPEERPATFAAISPALLAQELGDELIHRGVAEDIADNLIQRPKREGTEFFLTVEGV